MVFLPVAQMGVIGGSNDESYTQTDQSGPLKVMGDPHGQPWLKKVKKTLIPIKKKRRGPMRASRRHSLAPRTDGHALVVSLHERCIRLSDIAIKISYFGPESHWIGFLISTCLRPSRRAASR